MLADVVADALILECSQVGEDSQNKGRMRTHAYYVRAVGMAVGALAGSLFNGPTCADSGCWAWGLEMASLFWIQSALILLTVLPLLLTMYELPIRNTGVAGDLRTLSKETFEFLRHDGVWIPLMFLFFYNFLLYREPGLEQFPVSGVGLHEFRLRHARLRRGTFVGSWSLGVREVLLPVELAAVVSVGDVRRRRLLLPASVTGPEEDGNLLAVHVCDGRHRSCGFCAERRVHAHVHHVLPHDPPGAEGTVYALLSTWQSVADGGFCHQLGTYLTCVTDVSDSAIEEGKWAGVLKLTVICSAGANFTDFLHLYADARRHLLAARFVDATKAQCDSRKSSIGPWLFYFLFFGAIAFSLGSRCGWP